MNKGRDGTIADPMQLIRECVRGRRPWDDLAAIGITIERGEEGVVYSNPNKHVATALPEDVAEGLIRLSHDPVRLHEWAEILLGGSPFLELALEGHTYGEALLEGLWEASAGEQIRESALWAAKELYTN